MPATNKVPTQLLVSPLVKARAQGLALVRHESVAEVFRVALESEPGGLAVLEARHADALMELKEALKGMKRDYAWAVNDMLTRKLWPTDLRHPDGRLRGRYPTA